ncbi:MAG: hypothetical protein GX247_02855 [Mollicutes bacterium]|nr:hypothetical protein [Mollicutes bacterium]
MKKFRAKKRKKKKLKKYILFLLIIYFLHYVIVDAINNIRLVSSNEEFLRALMIDSNHHILYERSSKGVVNRIAQFLSNIDFNNPISIIEKSFGFNYEPKGSGADLVYNEDYYNMEELEKISEHIRDPFPVDVKKPRVYIYNSHQLENYNASNLEIYNITPNVMMASYLLKDKLIRLGIPAIAEEANFLEFMRINNWKHQDSYKASRFYIIDAFNKYSNSLDLVIDIHRDAVKKNDSTTTINGKKYAKVLFVIGLDNKKYKQNLELANKLNNLINQRYPTLSRGVLKKQGAGVDGVYNQDLSLKMILLEIGGVENTIDEVLNTVEAISIIIKEYLGA